MLMSMSSPSSTDLGLRELTITREKIADELGSTTSFCGYPTVPTSVRCNRPVPLLHSDSHGAKPRSRCKLIPNPERKKNPGSGVDASAIGNIIIAAAVAFNGMIGSRHHIPFSIASRASLGFYFSYFAVVSRMVLGLIYFG